MSPLLRCHRGLGGRWERTAGGATGPSAGKALHFRGPVRAPFSPRPPGLCITFLSRQCDRLLLTVAWTLPGGGCRADGTRVESFRKQTHCAGGRVRGPASQRGLIRPRGVWCRAGGHGPRGQTRLLTGTFQSSADCPEGAEGDLCLLRCPRGREGRPRALGQQRPRPPALPGTAQVPGQAELGILRGKGSKSPRVYQKPSRWCRCGLGGRPCGTVSGEEGPPSGCPGSGPTLGGSGRFLALCTPASCVFCLDFIIVRVRME